MDKELHEGRSMTLQPSKMMQQRGSQSSSAVFSSKSSSQFRKSSNSSKKSWDIQTLRKAVIQPNN